jgi:hypothetical protein
MTNVQPTETTVFHFHPYKLIIGRKFVSPTIITNTYYCVGMCSEHLPSHTSELISHIRNTAMDR